MSRIDGEALLHASVDCFSDGVVWVDPKGVVRLVNRAFRDMVGFSAEELLGSGPPFAYWPEEHVVAATSAFAAMMAGSHDDLELVLKRKNGQRFTVLVHPSTVAVAGEIVGYLATYRDISHRRAVEEAARLSEQRWRSIAENHSTSSSQSTEAFATPT